MNEHHDDNRTEREHPDRPQPRIWIGSLADYNAGRMHGDWVDAAVEADELLEAARRILATSHEPNAEEWGIFDYDEFGAFQVGEYEDLTRVARIARGIAEHGPAFAAWAQLHDGEQGMLDSFEDAFLGHYDAAVDWAHEVLDDHTLEADLDRAVPDSLRAYITIDYSAFVHDCQLGGDIDIESDPAGGVWIFRCNP